MSTPSRQRSSQDDDVDAVLAACRVLVAVSAQSMAAVEDIVDLVQFRILVVVAGRGSLSLGQLADAAHLHISKASRMCDRMVSMGLLNRADDPANRRQLILTLTPAGRRVVQTVMGRRRAAITPILKRMSKQQRAVLVSALRDFAEAGGEPTDPELWALGWTT
jgi:DNA-binding MarR family transcriptional regulator